MKKYGLVLTLAAVCCLMGSAWAQFTQVTINDLQNGSISENTNVEITGVVSAVRSDHVYVQESGSTRSGVRCYGGSVTGVNVGDTVTVQGEYYEYYGETEVDFSSAGGITVGSTGGTPYPPITVTGAQIAYDTADNTSPAEDYEGVLVTVNGVTLTTDSATLDHGMWDGTDDGGANTVRIDDDYFDLDSVFVVGQTYNITGIFRYDWDDFKINPRSALDIASLAEDSTPPNVVDAQAVLLTQVVVSFDEVMGATGLTTLTNYSIDNGIGNSTAVSVDAGGDKVTLTVPELTPGTTYTVTVSNLVDQGGNPLATNQATFSYVIPTVTINEIMYDSINYGLGDKEWVELHNTTGSSIDLGGWYVSDGEGWLILPAGTSIPASGYLVTSTTSEINIPGAVIGTASGSFFLGNGGDGLALYDASDTLIDGDESVFYPDLAGGNEGNSIEKNIEDAPYSGSEAVWQEASTPALVNPSEFNFATPGRQNNVTIPVTGVRVNEWQNYR